MLTHLPIVEEEDAKLLHDQQQEHLADEFEVEYHEENLEQRRERLQKINSGIKTVSIFPFI